MSAIQYGKYTISDKIGAVVGFSTKGDLKISEIGTVETKKLGGATVQEKMDGHGYSATGTLVLADGQENQARMYTVIQIQRGDETRPYLVQSWEESLDEETGGVVASMTATSYDSMLTEYAIGPRDPDTGEPLSGLVKFTLSVSFADYDFANTIQGRSFGLFHLADMPQLTGTTGNFSTIRAADLVDMSKAVATASLNGAQLVFAVENGLDNMVAAANYEGELLAWCGSTPIAYSTTTTSAGIKHYASNLNKIPLADASDSSSST